MRQQQKSFGHLGRNISQPAKKTMEGKPAWVEDIVPG